MEAAALVWFEDDAFEVRDAELDELCADELQEALETEDMVSFNLETVVTKSSPIRRPALDPAKQLFEGVQLEEAPAARQVSGTIGRDVPAVENAFWPCPTCGGELVDAVGMWRRRRRAEG